MKHFILVLMSLCLFSVPAQAAPEVGKAAPDFTATDIKGETIRLSDYKGKIVVLEWTNHLCPFVKKQYETGAMQKTQKAARDEDVTWLSIVSSAPGLQGHVTKEEAQKIIDENEALPTTKILDESGEIGKLYEARTTPTMFVVNKDGTLVYAGAIDDQPTPNHEGVENAKNYVLAALEDLRAGRTITTSVTEPYGCAVKYAH